MVLRRYPGTVFVLDNFAYRITKSKSKRCEAIVTGLPQYSINKNNILKARKNLKIYNIDQNQCCVAILWTALGP